MYITYKKLWHLLLDKGMSRQDLRLKTVLSTASLAKLSKGENISTDVLLRICEALDCNITDITETVRDEDEVGND